jgi:hypothetical protein
LPSSAKRTSCGACAVRRADVSSSAAGSMSASSACAASHVRRLA